MPQNILIATLGDHPAVVTGMVKALRAFEGIDINTLHVLHPQDTGKYIGREGFRMIEKHLSDRCAVYPEPLPFSDTNTVETSMAFLRALTCLLSRYPHREQHHVYLSLAGGRKNMSALMALAPQFFPAVRGLYHLLDRREGRRDACFYSIEEMELELSDAQIQDALDPPLDQLNLIPVPFPRAWADTEKLWQFINAPEKQDALPLSPEAEIFYRAIFEPQTDELDLDVWLSRTAVEQYAKLGNEDAERFRRCFLEMRKPLVLKKGLHHREQDLCIYKRTHRQRPFFYTTPNDIEAFPGKPVERVIVCGLSVEYALGRTGPYEPDIPWQIEHASREPCRRLVDLDARERILLVPLGKSPMIVTQTYTLLQESEEEGRPRIPTVAVVYPEQSSPIINGARMLKRQFKLRQVEFLQYPVRGFKDVNSVEACNAYLNALFAAIEGLRRKYPDRELALSLSGGRKGMSALTLLAAQRAGIERLYHTLITDLELEKQIEKESSLGALKKLPTDEARAKRLFLTEYGLERLQLFTIPVIPFASGYTKQYRNGDNRDA